MMQNTDKRCSDFDADCAEVQCKISCWLGGVRHLGLGTYFTPPSDGYCPFLRKEGVAHEEAKEARG